MKSDMLKEQDRSPKGADVSLSLEQAPVMFSLLGQSRPEVLVGACIGAWKCEQVLGRGGMSVVFEGVHRDKGHTAAIKLLLPGHADQAESHLRFQREAETLRQLHHPHIVEIYESEQDQQFGLYMVLERLRGMDLNGVLASCDGPLPLGWLMTVTEQICEALQVAHENGIVHRDLKPGNLFLLEHQEPDEPHVKLLDFGIAKVQHVEDQKRMTATGAILGTPAYLAPEQIKSKVSLTPATDIYALGVILYEALSGHLPIDGDAGFEHLLRILQSPPVPLGVHRPAFADTELEEVIMRMLSKDPSERPASVEICWSELSIAAQFLEDPLDLFERYPEIEDKPQHKSKQTPDVAPVLFSTDGEQIQTFGQPSRELPSGELSARTRNLDEAELRQTPAPNTYRMDAPVGLGTSARESADTIISPPSHPAAPLDDDLYQPVKPQTTKGWVVWGGGLLLLVFVLGVWLVGFPQKQKLGPRTPTQERVTQMPLKRRKAPQARPREREKPALRRVAPPKSLTPEELLAQAKALQHYQRAHQALARARKAVSLGSPSQLKRWSQVYQSQWRMFRKLERGGMSGQLTNTPEAMEPVWRRWKALLPSIRRTRFYHLNARFQRAEASRQVILARVKDKELRTLLKRSWTSQRLRAAEVKQILDQAHRAYKAKRWRLAHKLFRQILRMWPRSHQRGKLKKLIKACSCVLRLKPWEICTPKDYPVSYRLKKRR